MSQKPLLATYNIFSNRLFVWVEKTRDPDKRLSPEDYAAIKAIPGCVYWGGRGAFTFLWSPAGEDLIRKHFGMEIEELDEPDDVEARVGRFSKYAENDERDAAWARERILSGTANTRRRIEGAERVMTRKSDEAAYWHDRIASAIRHAQHKESPDVIRGRIKDLQKHNRKMLKLAEASEKQLEAWNKPGVGTEPGVTRYTLNYDPLHYSMRFLKAEFPNSTYEGDKSVWSAFDDNTITASQAQEIMIRAHERQHDYCMRWLEHNATRIEYWTAYLGPDAAEPEKPADTVPFKKGLWVIEKDRAFEIIRVNEKDVAVRYDNNFGYFRFSKRGFDNVFTKAEIDEMGVTIGSPVEAAKNLEFTPGHYAIVYGHGGRVLAYRIVKAGITKIKVATYPGSLYKGMVKEVVTAEEARARELIK